MLIRFPYPLKLRIPAALACAVVSSSIVWSVLLTAPLSAAEPTPEQLDFFESKVRPLLIEKCYECHSHEAGESEGELTLDNAAATRKGGTLGAALVPGKADQSLIVRAVEYTNNKLQMPPDGKLDQKSIDVLKAWINMGAPDPRTQSQVASPTQTSSPLDRDPASHWAFVNPKLADHIPDSDQHARDVIDAFATAQANAKGIKSSPDASRETLVRRLYFDLTGLPPSEKEIRDFVDSDRPDTYTRLVDRLLATPEFGERFGRHWLDVARYADTVGYALGGKERRIKGSQRYRDWTIRAFANDMPYDQMLLNQLAADRIDPENKAGDLDAMGFLTIGRRYLNGLDTIDDRIDVISRGLLGMTVACARCHDHKFDPIPTADYYSLFGVLESSDQKKDGPSPLMMVDKPKPHDSHVLVRGQSGNRGEIAPRQFLTSLRKPDEPRFTDGSGRWELAQRIASADNPLTARVMVNRLWAHLIGKPLVDSPSDFGFRTLPPAIPQVLDDLSAEFASHWSIKRTVRRIVLTRVYRQSSQVTESMIASDPDNGLLTRANRRRRDFESLRDSMLVVADSLNRVSGGQPVEISLPDPVSRRTVYAMIDRQNLPSLFRTFDFASPDAHSPQRYFTTVPQQALFLLNGKQALEIARRTAATAQRAVAATQRTAATAQPATDGMAVQVSALFRRVLSREPTDQERKLALEFVSAAPRPTTSFIDPRSLWSYGTATVDKDFKVQKFTPLPVFKSGQWQAEKVFPSNGTLGYASLGKESGHPGRDAVGNIVRRWKAPASGSVRIIGVVGHRSEQGDGIQATIVAGPNRLLTEVQKMNNRPYGPIESRIEAGEFVDFVASPGSGDTNDSFFWRMQIKLTADDGRLFEADSTKDFSGPFDPKTAQPLDRLAQLAHALLMSNEFAFVD